jgi:hypothetical protein
MIRDYVEQQEIVIDKIASDDNIADPLTKPLKYDKHEGHVISMGIKRVPELY